MIELIPKKVPQLPIWLNILFYVSLILLILVIAGFFILNHSSKKARNTLDDLNEELVEKETSKNLSLEKEVLNYEKKIGDFSNLIENHLKTSKVFGIIEKNCHPQVRFTQFSLESDQKTIVLTGETQSFHNLGQQFLLFQRENLIEKTKIENISIAKTGSVKFTFSFILKPQAFIK